jgi:hypothetical protein
VAALLVHLGQLQLTGDPICVSKTFEFKLLRAQCASYEEKQKHNKIYPSHLMGTSVQQYCDYKPANQLVLLLFTARHALRVPHALWEVVLDGYFFDEFLVGDNCSFSKSTLKLVEDCEGLSMKQSAS